MKKEFVQFNNGVKLAYSPVQEPDAHIIIYCTQEKAGKDKNAEFRFPDATLLNNDGFSDGELMMIQQQVNRLGKLALMQAREEAL